MGAFDEYLIHYEDIDVVDVGNVIVEAVRDVQIDGDIGAAVLLGLFGRGYVVVPVDRKGGEEWECLNILG